MATDSSSISGLLKQINGDLERAQNLKHRSIDEIGKSLKKYNEGGQGFFGAINDYGNESVGALNEGEQFRTIDSENYSQYKILRKLNYAPIEFSGLSAAIADSNEESFASAVADAMSQAKERLLSDENRQFFGVGTGALASPSANVASTATSFAVDSTQYLRRNQVVDIFNGATKTVDSYRIARVDHQNKVVYFSTSLSAALVTTDVIVKENVRDGAASDGKEMMGLRGIVDDGTDITTFQNISTAANDEWRSTVIDASSANLTSDLLQRLLDDVSILNGEEPDLLITHPKQRRKYLDLVVPQKRYMDGKMDTGFSEVSFNGKRMLLDRDCQSDVIYAISKKRIQLYEVTKMSMLSHDGSDVFLRVANYDKFQAVWKHYANFGTDRRIAHGKLTSLAVGSGLS